MTEYISKSEKKRQFKQTEQAAAELAEFSDRDLGKLPASDILKHEILACRGLKAGARKRQIKYLAKVMREDDLESIYTFLAEKKGSHLKSQKQFHEAERLRDAMINEALHDYQYCLQEHIDWDMNWRSPEIEEVMSRYPQLDESEIRKVVHGFVRTRNKSHYRELFRMMKAAIDQHDLQSRIARAE